MWIDLNVSLWLSTTLTDSFSRNWYYNIIMSNSYSGRLIFHFLKKYNSFIEWYSFINFTITVRFIFTLSRSNRWNVKSLPIACQTNKICHHYIKISCIYIILTRKKKLKMEFRNQKRKRKIESKLRLFCLFYCVLSLYIISCKS